MILDYDYWYFEKAIDPSLCDHIIQQGLAKMKAQEDQFGKEVSIATTGGWQHKGSEGYKKAVNDKSIEELKQEGLDPSEANVVSKSPREVSAGCL